MISTWWLVFVSIPAALVTDWALGQLMSPDSRAKIVGAWWGRGPWAAPPRSGYRPKPSDLPKLSPPGPSAVPQRPFIGYRAKRSVNPRTAVPPRSPTAVRLRRPAPNPTRPHKRIM